MRTKKTLGRGFGVVLICFNLLASGSAGVVARITPQSVVVCPNKQVTWHCTVEATCPCPNNPQRIIARMPIEIPIDSPEEAPGSGIDPQPMPPPQSPGEPPPESPGEDPYPPRPPNPPSPPTNPPNQPWPPGYPPGEPPEECENPPSPSEYRYTWTITELGSNRSVRGPEEGGPTFSHTFTPDDRGKRFRISCKVKVRAQMPDGSWVDCGETTAYAFARVLNNDELAVTLEAAPEPAGVWQTIMMKATVDQECGGTPPYTFTWTFGDDPDKQVVRGPQDSPECVVHYFYKQAWRYAVRVQVEDAEGRRGSATMWVHVALEVRLGIPMSTWVPLREYNQEGLADPDWSPNQINPLNYLHQNARYPARIVSVGIKGIDGFQMPFEYPHHQNRQPPIFYPRVDPLWGKLEILPVVQQAGVQVQMGTLTVDRYGSGWSAVQGWRSDLWWVPENTYLWPLNQRVRSGPVRAYWWNFWTPSPIRVSDGDLLHLRASAKLGWMETWDIASVVLVSFVNRPPMGSANWDQTNSGFVWRGIVNPCTGREVFLLMGGPSLDTPARVMATQVEAYHAWRTSQDTLQQAVAQAHRLRIQVGVVQSVEEFSRGRFSYTGYNERGDLWYYLPPDPPAGIPADPRYARPPLLDAFTCPNDAVQNAWYSKRGQPQSVPVTRNITAYSYSLLDNLWRAWIGYTDAPAFVVPPTITISSLLYTIDNRQAETPILNFYDAIAARTWFFPYSYVPVVRLRTWSMDFDGEVGSGNQYTGTGATEYNASLQKPETAYGPYNNYIRGQWQRR